jgi:hypothetical protein
VSEVTVGEAVYALIDFGRVPLGATCCAATAS